MSDKCACGDSQISGFIGYSAEDVSFRFQLAAFQFAGIEVLKSLVVRCTREYPISNKQHICC